MAPPQPPDAEAREAVGFELTSAIRVVLFAFIGVGGAWTLNWSWQFGDLALVYVLTTIAGAILAVGFMPPAWRARRTPALFKQIVWVPVLGIVGIFGGAFGLGMQIAPDDASGADNADDRKLMVSAWARHEGEEWRNQLWVEAGDRVEVTLGVSNASSEAGASGATVELQSTPLRGGSLRIDVTARADRFDEAQTTLTLRTHSAESIVAQAPDGSVYRFGAVKSSADGTSYVNSPLTVSELDADGRRFVLDVPILIEPLAPEGESLNRVDLLFPFDIVEG